MKQGWTYKKLGDCFPYIKNGANIKQIKGADGLPITRIETLSGGVFNRDRMGYAGIYNLDKYSDYVLEDGDLLLSHINSKTYIGRTVEYRAKNDETIIHGMNLLRLKSNSKVINSSFFAYYTLSNDFKTNVAKIRKDAVNQSSIAISDIRKFSIPVPPIQSQQYIVAELDKINELIRLKKEQLRDYDNLAQSIFYEMFGDKKYERRKLKNIVKVKSGQVSPLVDPYCDMVHVGPANIESNTGRLINLTTAKEENLISGKYLFDSSMVLYSKIRPNLNKVTIADFEGICSADMYPLIPSKSIDKKFLLFILKQKEFLSYAIANSGRANIPKINREALLEYSTILPPLSLQLQFAERLALIEQQKAEIKSTMADLETLLASRMQYWFD